jgi:hypothetical protein
MSPSIAPANAAVAVSSVARNATTNGVRLPVSPRRIVAHGVRGGCAPMGKSDRWRCSIRGRTHTGAHHEPRASPGTCGGPRRRHGDVVRPRVRFLLRVKPRRSISSQTVPIAARVGSAYRNSSNVASGPKRLSAEAVRRACEYAGSTFGLLRRVAAGIPGLNHPLA